MCGSERCLMWDKVENFIVDYLKRSRPDMSVDDECILRYGIQIYYFNISKLIIIVAIALLLGVFKEACISFAAMAVLRSCAYGFHADSFWVCLVISSANIFGITYLSMTEMPLYVKMIIIIVSYALFAAFVPADTENRPLPDANKRRKLKLKGLALCTLYTVLSFILPPYLANALILSMLFIGFDSSPILYKIFRKEYNNYEKIIT